MTPLNDIADGQYRDSFPALVVTTLARFLLGSAAIVVGLWAPNCVRSCAAQSSMPDSLEIPHVLDVPDEVDAVEELEAPLAEASSRDLEPLSMIRVDAAAVGPTPEDYSNEFFPAETKNLEEVREQRDWPATEFHWRSAGVCHPRLYFNHDSLEVHGHSCTPHIQPILSAVRFYGTIPLLPPTKLAYPHLAPHGGPRSARPCCNYQRQQ